MTFHLKLQNQLSYSKSKTKMHTHFHNLTQYKKQLLFKLFHEEESTHQTHTIHTYLILIIIIVINSKSLSFSEGV